MPAVELTMTVSGAMRPDYVPALAGESNESYGYAIYGRPPARYGRQVGEDVLR